MYIISEDNILDNTNRSFDEIWNYETSARDLERIIKHSTEGVIGSVAKRFLDFLKKLREVKNTIILGVLLKKKINLIFTYLRVYLRMCIV